MTELPPRLLYSIPDAAAQLSISERAFARLLREGRIDTVYIGRRRLVPHGALVEYIAHLRSL